LARPSETVGRSNMEKFCNVTVLLKPAADLPGVWTAHCLHLDLVTQGDGFIGAMAAIREAVQLVVDVDLSEGRDPLTRPSAPEEYWSQFSEVVKHGAPFDSIAAADMASVSAVVAQLRFSRPLHAALDAEFFETLPDPWVIAKVRGSTQQPSHC